MVVVVVVVVVEVAAVVVVVVVVAVVVVEAVVGDPYRAVLVVCMSALFVPVVFSYGHCRRICL